MKWRPANVALLRRRAQIYFVQGKVEQCYRDIARARALAPNDPAVHLEFVRALILRGEDSEAERALGGGNVSQGARDFLLGYLRCRQGRYKESRKYFYRARAAGAAEPHLASKAAFYGLVAQCLEGSAPAAPPAGKELLIIGLGYRQPFQVSRGALEALRASGMIYSNLSDTAVVDFLGLFPIPMQAIVFRQADEDAIKCAADVMPGFEKARRVAVVTRGHPLYYGRLAYRLTQQCQRRGIAVRVLPSVSISDTISGLVDCASGEALGCQVRNSSDLDDINKRLPLVLYNLAFEASLRLKWILRFAELYPPRHPCTILPGSGEREFLPRIVQVRNLATALERADDALTIFVQSL